MKSVEYGYVTPKHSEWTNKWICPKCNRYVRKGNVKHTCGQKIDWISYNLPEYADLLSLIDDFFISEYDSCLDSKYYSGYYALNEIPLAYTEFYDDEVPDEMADGSDMHPVNIILNAVDKKLNKLIDNKIVFTLEFPTFADMYDFCKNLSFDDLIYCD